MAITETENKNLNLQTNWFEIAEEYHLYQRD